MSKITLFIDDFNFSAIIGLLKKERNTPQKVSVSAQIKIDYDKKHLVDYVVLKEIIKNCITKEKFFTIEEALIDVCEKLHKEYNNIRQIDLKISKPDILKDAVVGAKIIKKYKKSNP